jgi:putative oxygen-independent coproporphyrinogen III oxidase
LTDFAVYVHWPFCKAKCPYCDFNSHVRHQSVDTASFADALCKELDYMRARTGQRNVTSVFFGGGTPSLMPPHAVAQVIDHISAKWQLARDAEITLEANPTSVSVGVQSLVEDDLKALGRQHTPEEALQAFRLAARIFPRVSFDMIYARPKQSLAAWRDELTRALSEQQGHMSLYQLTIEPETRYADLYAAGTLQIPEEDDAADLYELTQELTEKAGLPAYEVSNHAAAGHASRHNLTYWRYGEYAGAGPGAHGRIIDDGKVIATITEKHPETWRQLVQDNGHGLTAEELVPAADQAREMLLMGLRVSEGIEIARYEKLAGKVINYDEMQTLGFVDVKDGRLIATSAGRRILNAVIAHLA